MAKIGTNNPPIKLIGRKTASFQIVLSSLSTSMIAVTFGSFDGVSVGSDWVGDDVSVVVDWLKWSVPSNCSIASRHSETES